MVHLLHQSCVSFPRSLNSFLPLLFRRDLETIRLQLFYKQSSGLTLHWPNLHLFTIASSTGVVQELLMGFGAGLEEGPMALFDPNNRYSRTPQVLPSRCAQASCKFCPSSFSANPDSCCRHSLSPNLTGDRGTRMTPAAPRSQALLRCPNSTWSPSTQRSDL